MNFKRVSEAVRKKLSRAGVYTVSAVVGLGSPVHVGAQPFAPIVVSATLDLNFGTFAPGAAGGTVTISPAGARSSTGSVSLVPGSGLEAAGALSISASTGVSVVVSMTSPSFTLDDAGAGVPMTVDNFNINGAGATSTFLMTVSTIELPVGARLNVGAVQADGVYVGAYTVDANYL